MRLAVLSIGMLAAVLFGLGLLGAVHPMLDAIAIGRRLAVGVLCLSVTGYLLLSGWNRLAFGSFASVSLLFGAWFMSGSDTAGPLRVYSKNLFYAAPVSAGLIADIGATAPDIVILQEVSDQNRALLDMLRSDFPHQAVCPLQGWNGMAILSRWPLSDDAPRCSDRRSLMAVRVNKTDAAFWVVNVHLQQPWPDVQWSDLTDALWVIQELDGPAIVAGDFNTVPWTAAPRNVGQFTQTVPIGPKLKTYDLWGVPLPLDQMWAQGGIVQKRPKFQSDHAGIFGEVWLDTPTH